MRGRRAQPEWRRAMVTGASSGIGRAFAVALAAAGTDLVVVARRADRLEALAAKVRGEAAVDGGDGTGGARRPDIEVLVADLTDDADLRRVEARLADADRPVDLLVNNAGFGTSGPFADSSPEVEDREILLNVLAPVRLCRAVLPGMLERGRGGIVNMSSVAGLQPLPHWATYGATKAYLTSFSEALHTEVRGGGVTVLALMPGFTRTEFHVSSSPPGMGVPGPMWMTAEAVVESGLWALRRRRAGHVVGARNQVVAAMSRVTPWAVSRRVVNLARPR
ncbi:MAG: SDR family NAD(P)-dependent oxidoreductase [Acidimicrobiales bacterium]